jgi:membrane protease YdiL (CAAX protease family)
VTLRAGSILRAPAVLAGAPRRLASAWGPPAALLVTLAVVVALRWAATRAGLSPLAVGTAFGALLVALAWRRPAAPSAKALAIGALAGLALVGLTSVGSALGGVTTPPGAGRPAAPFWPWVVATILVAGGEEAFLRGRLFDATRRAGGTLAAVAITTVAFAILHVPLYGWHVVPLDLAVGLGFGALRILTRGIAAPAAAHAVADLATWWL